MTQLRDKDRTVLHQIHSGNTDTQQIKAATTLSNREINYSLNKLQDHGLVNVEKPDGMVTRVINGQKRVFEHPKQAQPTDKARKHLSEDPPDTYEDLSHEELVERVRELEVTLEELERSFDVFRDQIRRRLE